jgi:conjugal transfer pilus assembly protein TraU
MKAVRRMLATVLAGLLTLASPLTQAADSLTCTGRFPNPITEICWSCILPISIGSAPSPTSMLRKTSPIRRTRSAVAA